MDCDPIGWIDANTFATAGVPANTIMLKYTLAGDVNLDGTVGLDDYTTVIRNFGKFGLWTGGAVTYGNTVGLSDYTAVVRNFGQLMPAAEPSPASIPSIQAASATPTTPSANAIEGGAPASTAIDASTTSAVEPISSAPNHRRRPSREVVRRHR